MLEQLTITRFRRPICLLFLLIVQLLQSQTAGQLNIDTCFAMARRNYPMVKQYALIDKSREFTLSNANKAYLPQLSLTGIGGYVNGLPSFAPPGAESSKSGDFKFIGIAQLNQTLWDGGATQTQKKIAEASTELELAGLEVNLYTLRERVNQIYFGILVINEQLKQLGLLKEDMLRNTNKIKLSKENGLAFQSDADEISSELLLIEQKETEYLYSRKAYVEMLSYLIGSSLNENESLEKPSVIEPSGLSNLRPEIKWYNSQQKLIDIQSGINRVQNMPKIGLVGFGVMIRPESNFGTSQLSSLLLAGLSVSWNTGNLYKTSNNKNLDKIQSDRINIQKESFLFTNGLQLKQSNGEIEKQKAIINKDEEIISLKVKIKKAYELKYENGMCSMNDLLLSQKKENEARANKAMHEVQLLLNQYNYKITSGN